jgi:hypothetical protein
MPISSQLQQGIIDLLYFTWLHNAEALAYFTGCILSIFLQFKKPNRRNLLFFLSFLFLLFQFQYVKHIAEPLQEQTLQTVLQQGSQGLRFTKITTFFLQKFIPLFLYALGWGGLFFAIIFSTKTPDKEKE